MPRSTVHELFEPEWLISENGTLLQGGVWLARRGRGACGALSGVQAPAAEDLASPGAFAVQFRLAVLVALDDDQLCGPGGVGNLCGEHGG